jgi:hypothetical protein
MQVKIKQQKKNSSRKANFRKTVQTTTQIEENGRILREKIFFF